MNGGANMNGRANVEQALARLNFKPRELEPGHVWLAGAGQPDMARFQLTRFEVQPRQRLLHICPSVHVGAAVHNPSRPRKRRW